MSNISKCGARIQQQASYSLEVTYTVVLCVCVITVQSLSQEPIGQKLSSGVSSISSKLADPALAANVQEGAGQALNKVSKGGLYRTDLRCQSTD